MTKGDLGLFGGCCLLIMALNVAVIAAIVWAVLDLVSGHPQRQSTDIVILVVAVLWLVNSPKTVVRERGR